MASSCIPTSAVYIAFPALVDQPLGTVNVTVNGLPAGLVAWSGWRKYVPAGIVPSGAGPTDAVGDGATVDWAVADTVGSTVGASVGRTVADDVSDRVGVAESVGDGGAPTPDPLT